MGFYPRGKTAVVAIESHLYKVSAACFGTISCANGIGRVS